MEAPDPALTSAEPPPFVPLAIDGDLASAEAAARYRWVAGLAAGRRVLDVGCGQALGTALLHASGAASVQGVDEAQALVEIGRGVVARDVELRQGRLTALPFDDGAFDLVVCFDVLEHAERPEAIVAEIERVLAPGGVAAVSVAASVADPAGSEDLVAVDRDRVRAALGERFGTVRVHHQQGWVGSVVLGDDDFTAGDLHPVEGLEAYKAVGAQPGEDTVAVALAGHGELPDAPPALVLTGLVEVRRWLALYAEQREVLRRQHAHIDRHERHVAELEALRARLREAETRLATLPELEHDANLTRKERERFVALEQELGKQEGHIHRLEADVERARSIYADMQQSLSWKLTKPLRALKRR